METFDCIYCKKNLPITLSSRSDVIPDFLGNGLILERAVCKTCNNEFNIQVEQPLRNHFQFLRSGLDLKGRRGKPVQLVVDVEIESLDKKIRSDVEHIKGKGVPPFKFRGDDGKEYYAFIGKKAYIEEKKKEINSKKSNIKWMEANDKGEVILSVNALPVNIMNSDLAKRLAAKIAFERFCQKKSSFVCLDGLYDNIRNYIRDGSGTKQICSLIYNEKIMMGNMNFPFPCHSIILTHDTSRNIIVCVVSLFGLYYYLVKISEYLPINAPWDDCITIDPQGNTQYEPIIRGTLSIYIPYNAWIMNEAKLQLAGQFAFQKFKDALESDAFIVGTDN